MLLILTMFGITCAYYNTFYNAEQYYKKATTRLQTSTEDRIPSAVRQDFESAIEKANKTLLNYPDSKWVDDAQYLIAMSEYHQENYGRARKEMEKFLNQYPSSKFRPEMEISYGRCLWKMGERELARHQFNKIGRKISDKQLQAEIYFAVAELYQFSGEADSAIQYYRRVSRIRQAGDLMPRALFNLAEVYLQQNKTDRAIKTLQEVSRYSPPPEIKDRMQVLLAKIYRESGQYDKAKELIMKKLNDPKNENIWGDLEYELGLLYLNQKDYQAADLRFSEISEKYAGTQISAKAYYQRAVLNMTVFHDYEKAKNQFTQVRREDRDSEYGFESTNMTREISRYFAIKQKLAQLNKDVLYLRKALQAGESSESEEPESEDTGGPLKDILDVRKQQERANLDTVQVFSDYYQKLYELAEIYYFNFNQVDSARTYWRKIYRSELYNPMGDKALYALYWIFDDSGDTSTAQAYLDTLKMMFAESEYVNQGDSLRVQPKSTEKQAHDLFLKAEEWFEIQPERAIQLFSSVQAQYPDTFYGKLSILNIAWLFHHRLFDLENALYWYETYLDKYPDSEEVRQIRRSYTDLKQLQNELAMRDSISADSSQSDSAPGLERVPEEPGSE